jgi:group II intron reverse transcriptase/maturase
VWEAYQQVKANRGAAGIDDETIATFEQNLSKNLYKLWNRMSSGSYFPPPVKQVEIPKAKGGTRKLGIPTVSDRIAQTVVQQIIEPTLDPMFHPDSYGYRPGRSAKQAIAVTRKRCWEYDWVVEFDIKAAFDQIDHVLLMKAVRSHIKEDWILLYIERWLKAPFETAEGTQVPRERGTPQGGVVSPILMNLFRHYAFDVWMKRHYPSCPFARYADDAVVHCSSKQQGGARHASHRGAAGGMWINDASREVANRILSGQQPYRSLSVCAVHLSWFYVPAKESHEQAASGLYQFSARGER